VTKYLIIGFLLISIALSAYYYYNSTQSLIMSLTKNNAILEDAKNAAIQANEHNVAIINQQEKLQKEIQTKYAELQYEFNTIRLQNSAIEPKLDRSFNTIALDKTALLEKIINTGSDNALRCFEVLSGSPISLKEKNSECPWLFEIGEKK
jgi:hypothetical protein